MRHRIDLGEKLDTPGLTDLRKRLTEALGHPVELDGGNLRLLGGLCAQLLVAARHRWERDGLDFELLPSQAMRDDIRRLGLEAQLLTQDVQP